MPCSEKLPSTSLPAAIVSLQHRLAADAQRGLLPLGDVGDLNAAREQLTLARRPLERRERAAQARDDALPVAELAPRGRRAGRAARRARQENGAPSTFDDPRRAPARARPANRARAGRSCSDAAPPAPPRGASRRQSSLAGGRVLALTESKTERQPHDSRITSSPGIKVSGSAASPASCASTRSSAVSARCDSDWRTVVSDGLPQRPSGTSSKLTTSSCSGTRTPRPSSSASAPSAMLSLAATSASKGARAVDVELADDATARRLGKVALQHQRWVVGAGRGSRAPGDSPGSAAPPRRSGAGRG